MEDSKTRLIEFGRFAEENRKHRKEGKPETFAFLGFTHYCSKSVKGKFRVKRKTSKKKFAKKCRELNCTIRNMRFMRVSDIIKYLNSVLVGYDHYYGITDNYDCLCLIRERIKRLLFYWLNRRSQRRSYTWKGFASLMRLFPLVSPRIYVNLFA